MTTTLPRTGWILLLCAAQLMTVSGLVETPREIGGAIGVAMVATMLTSQAGIDGFQAAFVALTVIVALGAVNSTAGIPRHDHERIEA